MNKKNLLPISLFLATSQAYAIEETTTLYKNEVNEQISKIYDIKKEEINGIGTMYDVSNNTVNKTILSYGKKVGETLDQVMPEHLKLKVKVGGNNDSKIMFEYKLSF